MENSQMFEALFTDEERQKIYEFAKGKTRAELLQFVHKELKRTDVTTKQIRSYTNNHRDLWKIMGRDGNKRLLTVEQSNFAYEFAEGRSNKALRDALNEKFGLNLSVDQVCGWTKRRPDIRRKMVRYYHDPEYDIPKMMEPSHIAKRHPIGSVRETEYGVLVKIVDCKDQNLAWQPRSKIVWENAHGYTDKDIAHLDGNILNDSLDNLCPISKAARGYMAGHKLWVYDDPELTKARIAIAEVASLAKKLERENK